MFNLSEAIIDVDTNEKNKPNKKRINIRKKIDLSIEKSSNRPSLDITASTEYSDASKNFGSGMILQIVGMTAFYAAGLMADCIKKWAWTNFCPHQTFYQF